MSLENSLLDLGQYLNEKICFYFYSNLSITSIMGNIFSSIKFIKLELAISKEGLKINGVKNNITHTGGKDAFSENIFQIFYNCDTVQHVYMRGVCSER